MGRKIKEVDAYIGSAEVFAQPILKRLRRLFLKASPQLKEVIKWGVPYYEYNGLVGGFASFKKHAAVGFWKSKEMADSAGLFARGPKASMCTIRINSAKELPSDEILIEYIREAVRLNEVPVSKSHAAAGARAPLTTKKMVKRPRPVVPAILVAALRKNKRAAEVFKDFSPSCQREYVEWITEAKREETKEKRVQQAIQWMAEGKSRNWKYQQKSSKS